MDFREVNRRVIDQFRAGGEIDGMHRDRLVLLTTTGAKSGRPHTTPVMFQRDGDRILVIAANAGAPQHPDWYRNLVHDSRVRVEVGDDDYAAVAAELAGDEREQRWAKLKEDYPFFAGYEETSGRIIPVIALTRAPE